MENLTFEQLIGLCAIVIVFVNAYNAIMSAVKNRREEQKIRQSPVTRLSERVDKHDELLAKDKQRLDRIENSVSDMQKESTIMLRGIRSLLSHEINGNSIDKLETSASEIDDYLINRK